MNIITTGDLLHWENENTQKPNPRFPWRWYYRAPAADIEMTGYALMTYVSMAEEDDGSLIAQAMPIVRWLSKQRNSLGGFASTQVIVATIIVVTSLHIVNMP